jgi:signal transduction histidine kinase
MKSVQSITLRAKLRILELSFYFSSVTVCLLIIISVLSYKQSKSEEIKQTIKSSLGMVRNVVNKDKLDLLIKDIQHRTLLQEIFIFDDQCNLLTTTSLNFLKEICLQNKNGFFRVNSKFGAQDITISFRMDMDYKSVLFNNYKLAIIIFICIFILTYSSLFYFLKKALLTPLEDLATQVRNNQYTKYSFPKELGFIAERLWNLKEEISLRENEKAYYDLARTAIHDIRNPLNTIHHLLNNGKLNKEGIITHLNEIDFQINHLLKNTKKNESNRINLLSIIDNIVHEIEKTSTLEINVQSETIEQQTIYLLPLNEFEIKNILMNMVRNSIEAAASKVSFHLRTRDLFIEIIITDNGIGIPTENMTNVFTKNFSTKDYGFGIGLSSAKSFLQEWGGDIEINMSTASGASFLITIPFCKMERFQKIILIDDDKFVHASWEKSCQENDLRLESYFSVDSFLTEHDHNDLNIPVYIDSDLGIEQKGEELSKLIHDRGYRNIFLATSYDSLNLSLYPWIKKQVSKKILQSL